MAGWNGVNPFGNNYYGSIAVPQQAQPVMQNCFMPIQVRDQTEAENYPMAANTTISMTDVPMSHLWVKSTNANGTVVSFRTFNVSEIVEEKPQYVTKSDFDAFKKELLESIKGGNTE